MKHGPVPFLRFSEMGAAGLESYNAGSRLICCAGHSAECARVVMRWISGSLIAALLAAGVYLGSALVFVQGLAEAVRAGDAAAVVARTDLARVRHSLVDQIVAGYLKQLGRDRPVKPLERMLANSYGATIADALIAKLL